VIVEQVFEFPEGATPIPDLSGLIPTWVHNLHDLNRVEAENILKAQRQYLRGQIDDPKTWFHQKKLKNIHRDMFGDVWQWAGVFRKSITSIGMMPNQIPAQLAHLCMEVASWSCQPVELTFVEMAARIHHRLVFIHPFENGNGRFSRLIADRCLLAWKCPYPIWPGHLNQKGAIRTEYIQTLQYADRGDFSPLVELMKKFGASDPQFEQLFQNSSYKKYLMEKTGPAFIKALLRNGSDPNKTKAGDTTPLQQALKAGYNEIAELLIQAGAK